MKTKEEIIRRVKRMPEDALKHTLAYIKRLEDNNAANRDVSDHSWGVFALESGAFDFWNDPEEIDYSPSDLKEKK